MNHTRSLFNASYSQRTGQSMPEYIAAAMVAGHIQTSDNSSTFRIKNPDQQLKLGLEMSAPEEISQRTDRLNLTQLGRRLFLDTDPVILDVTCPVADTLLPENWSELTLADWQRFIESWPAATKRLSEGLLGYFNKNYHGFLSHQGQTTVIHSPFLTEAEIDRTVLHEYLHATHRWMLPSDRGALYGCLARF